MKVHIDFETRSKVDIWETGAWVYSTHPSTQVQCVAYAIDNFRPIIVNQFDIKTVAYELGVLAKDPNAIFVAHNAFFERAIWKNLMEPMGYAPIPLNRWRCTQAKALAYGLPKGLAKSADALGIEERKDKEGHQIMLRMCKPLKKEGDVYDEDPEHYKILYEYCKQDVKTERELDEKLPDLSPQEQEVWFYDQLINTRGVHVDMPTVRTFISILENKTVSLNAELVALTDGKVTKGTQVKSMLTYLNDGGAELPDLTKQTVTQAISMGRLTGEQVQVLRLRQQLGKSSLAKYKKLIHAVGDDGLLRDTLIYHGASTGRWSGRGVQVQNLPKGSGDTIKAISDIQTYGYPAVEMMYPGKLMDTLSSCIRGMIVPSEGKELYVVDYGAIEARVVMWLAGEERGLEEFKATDQGTDEDIYVKMAQRIYNNGALTKLYNPGERQLGKQAILGCGYGMGADKFRTTCAGYGIAVSESEASRIVSLYRETYYNVKNYWFSTEQNMRMAFEDPGKIVGDWIYRPEHNAMFYRLPSGRILTYLEPKMEVNRFGNMGMTFMNEVNSQWVRRDTYGGLLVENITQAVARDIMAYSIPRLEQAGYPTLMHTHDEIVSERACGEGKLQEMIDLMCVTPEWATGCPIVAEGFVCERYKKG